MDAFAGGGRCGYPDFASLALIIRGRETYTDTLTIERCKSRIDAYNTRVGGGAVFCKGAIVLITPLMKRAHEMHAAGDLIFVDSTSNLDTTWCVRTRSREAPVVSYNAMWRNSESPASKAKSPIALRGPLAFSRFSSNSVTFVLRANVT